MLRCSNTIDAKGSSYYKSMECLFKDDIDVERNCVKCMAVKCVTL